VGVVQGDTGEYYVRAGTKLTGRNKIFTSKLG